ncbi:oxidoreductase domain protein [Chthoniobacter flavus Ellin428]|uniref:Oxidoreductase domain protein n=1 Tax=Chthoniobacter flavus Ellin428 TaxID=497964 RepID=B4D5Q6_9BACT|nr:Gfo/Idh/MocA family oxidoreductase [Chthoniobacter flavus]EDY18109.1 oxidoreductase domain protein [Chthoniobacter flavus Ellin428]
MSTDSAADLRIGTIGLDTSHSVAFAKLLNDPTAPAHISGGRIVAAVKTFSPDMPASAERVEGFAATMVKDFGVALVPSIEELCGMVDVVCIESLDGRAHLEQARRVFAAKNPVFIDKPIAGTLRDVIEIFRLAREAGVPVFSSSAYRFHESLAAVRRADVGEVRSAISYGPAYLDPDHPDLFFYGVHPVEALYTVLGRGCDSVVRSHTADSDVVTGTWSGGRLGVLHGLRTKAISHKVIVFGSTGFAEQQPTGDPLSRFGALGAAQSSGGR